MNMLGLTRGLADRDLAELRSDDDAVFFTAFGEMITYPTWLVWPLAGLSLGIVIASGVLARRRGLATAPRMLAGAGAALLPLVIAPLAAIGWWQLLIMIRPGYGNLVMGDPYRSGLYRWALGALAVTILLAWHLALRRRIGPKSMAIGALVWPAVLGVVTAWLLPATSYYGSLSAAAAGIGALIALLIRDRRPGWSVVALTAGAVPGTVLLVMGGIALVGVLGIALGAAGVFFFVLAGLLILPLIELVLPAARRPSLLVVAGAAVMTMLLTGVGLAVDRFDEIIRGRPICCTRWTPIPELPRGPARTVPRTRGLRDTSQAQTERLNRLDRCPMGPRQGGSAPPRLCPWIHLELRCWTSEPTVRSAK